MLFNARHVPGVPLRAPPPCTVLTAALRGGPRCPRKPAVHLPPRPPRVREQLPFVCPGRACVHTRVRGSASCVDGD